ncbi:hypothetical protein [Streptomyces uncialis]|uniref:hypothetical protein n=1 Tax=Streptomyces uncialis TaxID=1048205 RepID=UPI003870EAB0|nr:hypothetical protein OG924_36795 [Streptomyces uncialis]
MAGRERDLRSQRRWIDTWWAVGLMALAVGIGVRLLFRDLDNWVAAVAGAGAYAIVFTVLMRRRQRGDARASGVETDDVPALERRLRRGDIPDDPALRQAMLQLIHRRRKTMHSKLVWAFPVMLLMFVALGVVLLAGGSAVAGAAWIVGGVVAVGGMWWMRRINLDRYRRAERRLNASPPQDRARSPQRDREQTDREQTA